jgi:hypothetical protein
MNMRNYILGFILFAVALSCVKPPEYPLEPVLSYNPQNGDGFNQLEIEQGGQGFTSDTLILTFSFTDGDGDIGFEVDSFDIFFTDSRDGFRDVRRLPVIPDEGTGNGIEGQITLRFPNQPFNICCTYDDGAPSCAPHPSGSPEFDIDTFSYTLQIRDRAGNFSNKIQTETVSIKCTL